MPSPRATDRRHLALAALSLAALLGAACESGPLGPGLRLSVAGRLTTGDACGGDTSLAALGADLVRLSVRITPKGGGTPTLCDTQYAPGSAPTLALSLEGSRFDLFAEAISTTGGMTRRLASGALLSLDPAATELPPLRLLATGDFRCSPKARLRTGRAFHSATALPGGQVLFIGGLAPRPSTSGSGFETVSTVEGYDPATGTFFAVEGSAPAARAFHRAELLGDGSPPGMVEILVTSGLGGMPGRAVLRGNSGGDAPAPSGFRWQTSTDSRSVAAEILIYDPATRKILGSRRATGTRTATFQAAARLTDGTVATAGGAVFGAPPALPTFEQHVTLTRDGENAREISLTQPRMGAALTVLPGEDSSGKSRAALLVGGAVSLAMAVQPVVRLDLLNPLVATPSSVAPVGSLPAYQFPTVTLLDSTGTGPSDTQRLILTGGLLLENGVNGPAAVQPPPMTLQLLTVPTTGPPKVTSIAPNAPDGFDPSCTSASRYRPVAFDAATRLPTGDRVLSSGGTPRRTPGCDDCLGGDTSATDCAVPQAIVVSATAGADPTVGSAGTLQVPRFGHTQTLLPDGTVLVAGGLGRTDSVAGKRDTVAVLPAELWNPARADPAMPDPGAGQLLIDPDDPLRAELSAANLSRVLSSQAYAPGDAQLTPKIPCPTVK